MYDLIASWMTSGGPLQELTHDDRGRIRHTAEQAVEPTPARARASRLFARRMHAARPLETCACLTDQSVPC